MSEHRSVEIIVRGRVQGVGYRAWTKGVAEARGLSGTVRNRHDGSVEVRLAGPAEAIAQMIEACRQGPPGARVQDLSIQDLSVQDLSADAPSRAAAPRGVQILPTA
ncbi:acylphosphatase [Methylobacterium frigidaeris]|uniref:acylphosphatase n=1 Tax=Methylobacterium frigidaeris TaxID=2038277 RepID=A0AA37H6B2_9HYPH|nr:acylphosphatase [Methylobacterium frigidaeris]PIK70430.1 acylphosphatase [Methylobacterium frigidaeris]GJD60140.1 Acylphosphatase [Methylobacterium frigidaeris]